MSDHLADEMAVRRTLAEYCQYCDDGRFDDFAACFTEDATMVVMGREVRGRAAVRDWVAAAMPVERRGKHVCANPLLDLDGDRATGSTDFLFVSPTPTGPRVTTTGRYLDEFRRDGGRWLLARREIVLLGGGDPG